jgi:hypothetical protein
MVPDDVTGTDERTRRDVLRSGAGALAAGVATLTAGCASGLPPLGTERRFGRVDAPPADPPSYRRWLPAPSAVDGERAHYPVLVRRPTALAYPAPVRFTTPRKRLLADLDHFGVGYAGFDRLVHTEFGTVLEGGFEASAVADALVASGYRREGETRGHDAFARDDVARRAVVTDRAVVWSSERVHASPDVAALLDAGEGRVRRYHDASEAVERLGDVIGESRMVEVVPPSAERPWTKCEGFRFDGNTAYHVVAFLYPEGETVPEDRLRRRSKRGTVLTREVENSEVSVDGRLVTIEGSVPPSEGVQPSAIDPPYPPQVTWGVEREAGRVTLRHEAGTPTPASALAFQFGVDAAAAELTLAESRPLPTDADELRPGDAVPIDVGTDPTVEVIDRAAVDHDAEDPFEAREPRAATHVEVGFAPGNTWRELFRFELEGAT